MCQIISTEKLQIHSNYFALHVHETEEGRLYVMK